MTINSPEQTELLAGHAIERRPQADSNLSDLVQELGEFAESTSGLKIVPVAYGDEPLAVRVALSGEIADRPAVANKPLDEVMGWLCAKTPGLSIARPILFERVQALAIKSGGGLIALKPDRHGQERLKSDRLGATMTLERLSSGPMKQWNNRVGLDMVVATVEGATDLDVVNSALDIIKKRLTFTVMFGPALPYPYELEDKS